jgi:hypothetical protein
VLGAGFEVLGAGEIMNGEWRARVATVSAVLTVGFSTHRRTHGRKGSDRGY